MYFAFKKLIFTILFNTCLFFVLIIAIQNSSNKSKVNFLFNQTVSLPISFILGTSFISGSILGNIISLNFDHQKNN